MKKHRPTFKQWVSSLRSRESEGGRGKNRRGRSKGRRNRVVHPQRSSGIKEEEGGSEAARPTGDFKAGDKCTKTCIFVGRGEARRGEATDGAREGRG